MVVEVCVWGVSEMYGHILKIHFCFFSDAACLQRRGQDFITLYKSCED